MSNYEYIEKSPLGISSAIYQVKRNFQQIGYICCDNKGCLYFIEQPSLYPTGLKIQQTNLDALKAEIENYFK
ncbi:hypothetical protein [Cysteiniphilum sp. 6C5]|uniref:hypothetical protein n=1 Tax=unclassified Cysteiniphilum TaxID=2610889 RepID=UPI003F8363E6